MRLVIARVFDFDLFGSEQPSRNVGVVVNRMKFDFEHRPAAVGPCAANDANLATTQRRIGHAFQQPDAVIYMRQSRRRIGRQARLYKWDAHGYLHERLHADAAEYAVVDEPSVDVPAGSRRLCREATATLKPLPTPKKR